MSTKTKTSKTIKANSKAKAIVNRKDDRKKMALGFMGLGAIGYTVGSLLSHAYDAVSEVV